MTDCPKCLGLGTVVIHNKEKTCNLCNGEKKIANELEEDYISSLHVWHD